MKKMKVIIDAQEAVGHDDIVTASSGMAQFELNLIKKLLARNRFEYKLAFFDHNGTKGNRKRAEERFGTDVYLLECREAPYFQIQSDTSKSYEEYFDIKADIYWFPCSIYCPAIFKGSAVVTVHDLALLYTVLYDNLEMINIKTTNFRNSVTALKKYTTLIAVDSYRSKYEVLTQKIADENKINVVHISCNEDKMYSDNDNSALNNVGIDGKYFLSIGRFEAKKNQVSIIRAFEVVANNHSDVKLVLIGNSDASNRRATAQALIMSLIESSPFKDRIVITGVCNEDDKRVLLSNAYALVFPSIHEGFGLPILEAMRCGCPVITSNVAACPEIAGEAGILVPPTDALEIANAMEKVITSDELRHQMRENGFMQAKRFSWDKAAEQMEDLFLKASKLDLNC